MQNVLQASILAQSVLKEYRQGNFKKCLDELILLENQPKYKSFYEYTQSLTTVVYFELGDHVNALQCIQNILNQSCNYYDLVAFDQKSNAYQMWKIYSLIIQQQYKQALVELKLQEKQLGSNSKIKSQIEGDDKNIVQLEQQKNEILLIQSICESLNTNSISKKTISDLNQFFVSSWLIKNQKIIPESTFYRQGLAQWNLFNCTSFYDHKINPYKLMRKNFIQLQNILNVQQQPTVLNSINDEKQLYKYGQNVNQENNFNPQQRQSIHKQKNSSSLIQNETTSQYLSLQIIINIFFEDWQGILDLIQSQYYIEEKSSSSQQNIQNIIEILKDDSQTLTKDKKQGSLQQESALNQNLTQQYLFIISICYEMTKNYKIASFEYEKILSSQANKNIYDIVKLNLANCFIIQRNLNYAKQLLEIKNTNNSYDVIKMYNQCMVRIHFENDFEGALGLLCYIETQYQGSESKLFLHEELQIYKAIALSKCGEHIEALKVLEECQIIQNFSSIIIIATLSYLITEYNTLFHSKSSRMSSVDYLARFSKIIMIETDHWIQKFFQGKLIFIQLYFNINKKFNQSIDQKLNMTFKKQLIRTMFITLTKIYIFLQLLLEKIIALDLLKFVVIKQSITFLILFYYHKEFHKKLLVIYFYQILYQLVFNQLVQKHTCQSFLFLYRIKSFLKS